MTDNAFKEQMIALFAEHGVTLKSIGESVKTMQVDIADLKACRDYNLGMSATTKRYLALAVSIALGWVGWCSVKVIGIAEMLNLHLGAGK